MLVCCTNSRAANARKPKDFLMVDYFFTMASFVTPAKVGKRAAGGQGLWMCGKKEGCLGIGPKKPAVGACVVTQQGGRIFVYGQGINLPGRTLLDEPAIPQDQDLVCPGEDVDRIM